MALDMCVVRDLPKAWSIELVSMNVPEGMGFVIAFFMTCPQPTMSPNHVYILRKLNMDLFFFCVEQSLSLEPVPYVITVT